MYQEKVSGNKLALHFDVSTRTIQNYVREINLHYDKLIASSRIGYEISDRRLAETVISQQESQTFLPETNTERSLYIIKQLLISKRGFVRVRDIVNELYISLSTLNNAIAEAKRYLKNHDLSICYEKNKLIVTGDENNKRKLLSLIIYQESSRKMLIRDDLLLYFGHNILATADLIMRKITSQYDYTINEFAHQNLLLHICILIFRVMKGNLIDTTDISESMTNNDQLMLEDLNQIITDNLAFSLNKNELLELYILIRSKSNMRINSTSEAIEKMLDHNLIELSQNVVHQVKLNYNIDIDNDTFKLPFSLHLKSLLFRVSNHAPLKNPSSESIRKNYPLIYDIATHIALCLKEWMNIVIKEDEISFIALHIGAELERQKEQDKKISTILIAHSYLDISRNLLDELIRYFDDKINVLKVFNNLEEAMDHIDSVELVISTIEYDGLRYNRDVEFLFIPQFGKRDTKFLIHEALENIEHRKQNNLLIHYFDKFFNADLFLTATSDIKNETDAIRTLSSLLYEQGYVNHHFVDRVLEREESSSTAFGNIAVPHQFIEPSFKTGIAIMLAPNKIKWNTKYVNVVLLVSIKSEDRQLFKQLYEALLYFFTQEQIVEEICMSKHYEDFKQNTIAYAKNS